MKKLSFIFAMVFAASMAMAQHVDVVNQTGAGNVANVDQDFMPSPGPNLIGNEAYVDQVGGMNDAEVDQTNNGYAGAQHYATVYSEGLFNDAKVEQINHGGKAYIKQDGGLTGGFNDAKIFQSGNFGTPTVYNANYNAFALQMGSWNDISITAWGTNASAYAEQWGKSNEITQELGSGLGEKVENSHFAARQYGNRNTAVQMMEGEGWAGGITAVNNLGKIRQDGNDNLAKQHMHEYALSAAFGNTALAKQDGNWNESIQNQTGSMNISTVDQTGNANDALATQIGSLNQSIQVQNWNGNESTHTQIGVGNYCVTTQN